MVSLSLTPHGSPSPVIMVSSSAEENKRGRKSPEADSPEKSEGAPEDASSAVPHPRVSMKKSRSSLRHAPNTSEDPARESAPVPVPRTWAKMKKSKRNLPPMADDPKELTEAAPSVLRTWAAMKKRPHASNTPEKAAASAKRKKGKHHAKWNGKGAGKKNPRQAQEERQFVSSLTEPELDFLISLKQLAERRAETIRQSTLANKFDIRILRALGFVLLEYFKEECKRASIFPDNAEASSGFNQFNMAARIFESNDASPGAYT